MAVCPEIGGQRDASELGEECEAGGFNVDGADLPVGPLKAQWHIHVHLGQESCTSRFCIPRQLAGNGRIGRYTRYII